MHLGLDMLAHMVLEGLEHRSHVVVGKVPEFEVEVAVPRHDVELRAAPDETGVHGAVRRNQRFVEGSLVAVPPGHALEEGDCLRRRLHRIDTEVGHAGVGLEAADVSAVAQLALVRTHHLHLGGFTHEHRTGLHLAVANQVDEPAHAEAADLFVVGEDHVQRDSDLAREKLRREREAHCDEALHVGGAPSIEATVSLQHFERIAFPGLALDRHHVGVPGERDAGAVGRTESGVEVRLCVPLVVDELAGDAEIVEVPGNKVDEREIRAFAHGIERDQPPNQIKRRGARRLPGVRCQCVRHVVPRRRKGRRSGRPFLQDIPALFRDPSPSCARAR